jgi:hypothetical protein
MWGSKFGVAASAALALLVPLPFATRSASAAPAPGTVLIYGDSIMAQAAPTATAAFATHAGWSVVFSTFPGEALCDWLPAVSTDLATYHPTLVVLETMGNTETACTTGLTFGSSAWLDRYTTDLATFYATVTATGAKVEFLKPLPVSNLAVEYVYGYANANAGLTALNNAATAQALLYHGVSVSRGPRFSVSTSTGAYTATKACLASETVAEGCDATTSEVSVRSEDGLHLCDITAYPDVTCQTYSSGALRYGEAVVAAAMRPPAPLLP